MKTIDQILKIKAVVLYILKAFPEGVDYIHLFKVMYFAQQNQLKEYGLPIVYDTFVARKHGPVPTLTYKVLRGVEGKTEISSELKDFAASLDIELSKEVINLFWLQRMQFVIWTNFQLQTSRCLISGLTNVRM